MPVNRAAATRDGRHEDSSRPCWADDDRSAGRARRRRGWSRLDERVLPALAEAGDAELARSASLPAAVAVAGIAQRLRLADRGRVAVAVGAADAARVAAPPIDADGQRERIGRASVPARPAVRRVLRELRLAAVPRRAGPRTACAAGDRHERHEPGTMSQLPNPIPSRSPVSFGVHRWFLARPFDPAGPFVLWTLVNVGEPV